MAARKWKMIWGYGYTGTDNEEEVDLADYLGISQEEADAMSDEDAQKQLNEDCWEMAIEEVEAWAEPIGE